MNDLIKIDRERLEELALLVNYLQCDKDDITFILNILNQSDKIDWKKENKAYFFTYVLFNLYLRLDLFRVKGVINNEEFQTFDKKGLYIEDIKNTHRHLNEGAKIITEDDIMLMNRIWYTDNENENLNNLIIQVKNLIRDKYYEEFKEHFMLYCQLRDDNDKLFNLMGKDYQIKKLINDIIIKSETKDIPYYTFCSSMKDDFVNPISFEIVGPKKTHTLTLFPHTTLYEVILIISLREKILFDSISIKNQTNYGITINKIKEKKIEIQIDEEYNKKFSQYVEDFEENIRLLLIRYYNEKKVALNNLVPYFNSIENNKIQNDFFNNITPLTVNDWVNTVIKNIVLINLFITFQKINDQLSLPYLRNLHSIRFNYIKKTSNELGFFFTNFTPNTNDFPNNNIIITYYYYIQRKVLYELLSYDNILCFWFNDYSNLFSDELYKTFRKNALTDDLFYYIYFYHVIIKGKGNKEDVDILHLFNKTSNRVLYSYYYFYLIHNQIESEKIKAKILEEKYENGLINYITYNTISKKDWNFNDNIIEITIIIDKQQQSKKLFYSNTTIYELLFSVMIDLDKDIDLLIIRNNGHTINKEKYSSFISEFELSIFNISVSSNNQTLYKNGEICNEITNLLLLIYNNSLKNEKKNEFLSYLDDNTLIIKQMKDKLYNDEQLISLNHFIELFKKNTNDNVQLKLLRLLIKTNGKNQFFIRSFFTKQDLECNKYSNLQSIDDDKIKKFSKILLDIKRIMNGNKRTDNIFSYWNQNTLPEWKEIKKEIPDKSNKKLYQYIILYYLFIKAELVNDFDLNKQFLSNIIEILSSFITNCLEIYSQLPKDKQKEFIIELKKIEKEKEIVYEMIKENEKRFLPRYVLYSQDKVNDIDLFKTIKIQISINNINKTYDLLPYTTLYELVLIIALKEKKLFDTITIQNYSDLNIPICELKDSTPLQIIINDELHFDQEELKKILEKYYNENYSQANFTFLDYINQQEITVLNKEQLSKVESFVEVLSSENNYYITNLIIALKKEDKQIKHFIRNTMDQKMNNTDKDLIFISNKHNQNNNVKDRCLSLLYYLQKQHYSREFKTDNVLSFWFISLDKTKEQFVSEIIEIIQTLQNSPNEKEQFFEVAKSVLPSSLYELIFWSVIETQPDNFKSSILNEISQKGVEYSFIKKDNLLSNFNLITVGNRKLLSCTSIYELTLLKILNEEKNEYNYDTSLNKTLICFDNNIKPSDSSFFENNILKVDVEALLHSYFTINQNETKQLLKERFLDFLDGSNEKVKEIKDFLFEKGQTAITRDDFFNRLSKKEPNSIKILNLLIGFDIKKMYLRNYFTREKMKKILDIKYNDTLFINSDNVNDQLFQKYYSIYYQIQSELNNEIKMNDNLLSIWKTKVIVPEWNTIKEELFPKQEEKEESISSFKQNNEELLLAILMYYILYKNALQKNDYEYIPLDIKIYENSKNEFIIKNVQNLKEFIYLHANNDSFLTAIKKQKLFDFYLLQYDQNPFYYSFYSDVNNFNKGNIINPINVLIQNMDNQPVNQYSFLPYTTIFEVLIKIVIDNEIALDNVEIVNKQNTQEILLLLLNLSMKDTFNKSLTLKVQINKKKCKYMKDAIQKLLSKKYEGKTIDINELFEFLNKDSIKLIKNKIKKESTSIEELSNFLSLPKYKYIASLIFQHNNNDLSFRKCQNPFRAHQYNMDIFVNYLQQDNYDSIFLSMYYYILKELVYQDIRYDNILSFWYKDNIDWTSNKNWDKLLQALKEKVDLKLNEREFINIKNISILFPLLFYFEVIKTIKGSDDNNENIDEKERLVYIFLTYQIEMNQYLYSYFYSFILNHGLYKFKKKTNQFHNILQNYNDNGLLYYISFNKTDEHYNKPFNENVQSIIYFNNSKKNGTEIKLLPSTTLFELLIFIMIQYNVPIEYIAIEYNNKKITKNDYNKTIINYPCKLNSSLSFKITLEKVPNELYYTSQGNLKPDVIILLRMFFNINCSEQNLLDKEEFLSYYNKIEIRNTIIKELYKSKKQISFQELYDYCNNNNNKNSMLLLHLIISSENNRTFSLRNLFSNKGICDFKIYFNFDKVLFIEDKENIDFNRSYNYYLSIFYQISIELVKDTNIKPQNILKFWFDNNIPEWSIINADLLNVLEKEQQYHRENIYQFILFYYIIIQKVSSNINSNIYQYLPIIDDPKYIQNYCDLLTSLPLDELEQKVGKNMFDKLLIQNESQILPYFTVYNKNPQDNIITPILFKIKTNIDTLEYNLLPYTTLYEVVLMISLEEKILFDSISIKGNPELNVPICELKKNEIEIIIDDYSNINSDYLKDNKKQIKKLLQYWKNYNTQNKNLLDFINIEKIKNNNEIKEIFQKVKNKEYCLDTLIADEYKYILNLFIKFRKEKGSIKPYLRNPLNRNATKQFNPSVIFRHRTLDKEIDETNLTYSLYYYIMRDIKLQIPQDNILSFWYNKINSFPSLPKSIIQKNTLSVPIVLIQYYLKIKRNFPKYSNSNLSYLSSSDEPQNQLLDFEYYNNKNYNNLSQLQNKIKDNIEFLLYFMTNNLSDNLSNEVFDFFFSNSIIKDAITKIIENRTTDLEYTLITKFLSSIAKQYQSIQPLLFYMNQSNINLDTIWNDYSKMLKIYIKPYLVNKNIYVTAKFIKCIHSILYSKFEKEKDKEQFIEIFYFCGQYKDNTKKLSQESLKAQFVKYLVNKELSLDLRKSIYYFLSRFSCNPEQYIFFDYFEKPKSIDELLIYSLSIQLYSLKYYRKEILALSDNISDERKEFKTIFTNIKEKKDLALEKIDCKHIKQLLSNKSKSFKAIIEYIINKIEKKNKIHIIKLTNEKIKNEDDDLFTLKGVLIFYESSLIKSIIKNNNKWIEYKTVFNLGSFPERITLLQNQNALLFYEDDNEKENDVIEIKDYFTPSTNYKMEYESLIYTDTIFWNLMKNNTISLDLEKINSTSNPKHKFELLKQYKFQKGNKMINQELIMYNIMIKELKDNIY